MSELQAGRELDALVAEKVMGWTSIRLMALASLGGPRDLCGYAGAAPRKGRGKRVPRYSSSIADAWLVVEKMREHPEPRYRTLRMVAYPYNRTYATFDGDEGFYGDRPEQWVEANGEHATPLAICRAALACVEGTHGRSAP